MAGWGRPRERLEERRVRRRPPPGRWSGPDRGRALRSRSRVGIGARRLLSQPGVREPDPTPRGRSRIGRKAETSRSEPMLHDPSQCAHENPGGGGSHIVCASARSASNTDAYAGLDATFVCCHGSSLMSYNSSSPVLYCAYM